MDTQPQGETTPKPAVTVAEADQLVKDIFAKRTEIDAASAKVTDLNKELAAMQAKLVLYLKELGRDNYRSSEGTISIVEKWRVNLPSSVEDRERFFAYLREKGLFDQMISVNANTLNAYFTQEWANAIKEGRGMEFEIPGISPPKLFETISMRKGK